MGKLTISMVIFNSYFDITRGYVNCSMSEFTEFTECGDFGHSAFQKHASECPKMNAQGIQGSGSFVSSLQLRTRNSQNLPEPCRFAIKHS